MDYLNISNTPLKVSAVGFGSWVTGGSNWGAADDAGSIDAIRAAIDSGVNLIDTAPVYGAGHAEELVGKAVAGRREQVVLSTKCGLLIDERNRRSLAPDSIRREADASLRRLGTDVIDVYFCHWPDKDTPIEESVGALADLRDQGKIRAFGLSNHSPDLVERAAASGPLCCLQDHYSLLRRDIEKDLVPCAARLGLSIMAYAPLGGGILTGKYTAPPAFSKRDVRDFFYPFYREPLWSRLQPLVALLREIAGGHAVTPAQVAIAWVMSRESIVTALVGARTPEQARSNALGGSLTLDSAELTRLTALSDEVLAA